MKRVWTCSAGLVSLVGLTLFARPAHGDLVDVTSHVIENGIDGVYTVQVRLNFDDPTDVLRNVYGNGDYDLAFSLGGGSLVNFGDNGGSMASDDYYGNDPFDSWYGYAGDLAGR